MTLFELEALLTLDTTDFDKGISQATSDSNSLAKAIGADADSIKGAFSDAFAFSVGQLMADAVKKALQELVEFAAESITVASDLEQTNEKINAVFGETAPMIHAWATTTKEQFGIGEIAAKSYAGQVAGILSTDSLALSTEQIYEMSTSLVELAGDLASFHNMDFDTVWFKILSGLRGETEAIEDLGIDMRATAVGMMYGMSGEMFGALAPGEQIMKRYEYIMANTTVAQGDFVRTQYTYANQLRVFEQNVQELQATLATDLLPVLTDLLVFANSLFGGAKDADEVMEELQDGFVSTYVDIDTTTKNALALVQALEELESQGIDTEEEQSAWEALLEELTNTLPELSSIIDATTGSITGGTTALRDYIGQWQETQRELAFASVMQDAYAEIAAQAKTVAELQLDLAMAQATIGNQTTGDIVEQARAYLAEEYGYNMADKASASVMLKLEQIASSKDDAYAAYLVESYDAIAEAINEAARLEAQVAEAQARLDELNAEYLRMETQVKRLVEGVAGGENTGDYSEQMTPSQAVRTMQDTINDMKGSVIEAIKEGLSGISISVDGVSIANVVSANMSRTTRSKVNSSISSYYTGVR